MKAQIETLSKTLPPVVSRNEIEHYLGGLISKRYLANLDCIGMGPNRIKIGRKVGYIREDLIEWLVSRSKDK